MTHDDAVDQLQKHKVVVAQDLETHKLLVDVALELLWEGKPVGDVVKGYDDSRLTSN